MDGVTPQSEVKKLFGLIDKPAGKAIPLGGLFCPQTRRQWLQSKARGIQAHMCTPSEVKIKRSFTA